MSTWMSLNFQELGIQLTPLIYALGDELDSDHPKIESQRSDFDKNLKSFWYFKASNYHKLVRFIDSLLSSLYWKDFWD